MGAQKSHNSGLGNELIEDAVWTSAGIYPNTYRASLSLAPMCSRHEENLRTFVSYEIEFMAVYKHLWL